MIMQYPPATMRSRGSIYYAWYYTVNCRYRGILPTEDCCGHTVYCRDRRFVPTEDLVPTMQFLQVHTHFCLHIVYCAVSGFCRPCCKITRPHAVIFAWPCSKQCMAAYTRNAWHAFPSVQHAVCSACSIHQKCMPCITQCMVAGTVYAWTAHKNSMEQAKKQYAMHFSWLFKLHGDHAVFIPAGNTRCRSCIITAIKACSAVLSIQQEDPKQEV